MNYLDWQGKIRLLIKHVHAYATSKLHLVKTFLSGDKLLVYALCNY